jgi:uncharacterized Zn-binding protein involved in type VI secretion
MAGEIIRQGDRTSHGGVVLEGSMTDICHGKPISSIGHKVQCPLCKGVFPIVEGVMTATIFGKGVAVAGMKTACGASLIPSQFTDIVEWASSGASTIAASRSNTAGGAPTPGTSRGGAVGGAVSEAASETAGETAGKEKITRLYWTYGPDEMPVTDVSRHYVDLNLHIETENYQPGESAVVTIGKDDESALAEGTFTMELQATVGADGTAKLKDVFRNKTLEIGTFS